MRPAHRALALACALTSPLLLGCDAERPASRAQMRDAVAEVALLGDGIGAQTEIIELTTSFTLGAGVQATVQEVRDFVASQVACSDVTVEPGSITIDFGDRSDDCTYRGRTYAGVVSVQFEDTGESFIITHTYEGLTGGKTVLDGTAVVTWDGNVRTIVTDLDFVGERGELYVNANRTQTFTACEDAQAVCVLVEGERDWTGPRGAWETDIQSVQARSIDPVPYAGRYVITTPDEKTIELAFARVDSDTIAVTVEGGRAPVVLHVSSAGQISEQ